MRATVINEFALGTAVLLVAVAGGAQPRVSNRPADVTEWGYRPEDGAKVNLNPPSLTWPHEPPAQTYTVQWSPTEDFQAAITVTNLWFNTYTHDRPLPAREYYWRYRFTTADGAESTWSLPRRFTVPPDAPVFPLPGRAERHRLIPSGHPRLFVRPTDLPALRALAEGREAARFAELRRAADRLLCQPPTPEPTLPGSATDKNNLALLNQWWPNREQTLRACTEAETLAFVYLMTCEKKYGDAARERIVALAGWDPDGQTNFRTNCEAAKPLLHRLSRAYDWAYDALRAEDRAVVRRAVTRRIRDAWESGEVGRGVGHLTRPFNSHGNRTWHKIGESGIVFLGEIPEAERWLDYALNKFYACYPVWADEDGGWHEGLSYWAGYLSKAVWWLHAMERALGVNGLQKPFFDRVGDFALYVAPPGSPNSGFGDLSHRPVQPGSGTALDYFIRASAARPAGDRAAYWRWWYDAWALRGNDGVLGFLFAALLPPMADPKPPDDLPTSRVFRGVGVASLHTTLTRAEDDVHVLFKSSPFGSQSHGHNAQNSFQLNAYGDALLPACVYRDWHGSAFHQGWAHQTIAQNAVLVNGRGQLPASARAQGRIVDFQLTAHWDYVQGDATAAYDGRLQQAARHVLFIKRPPVLVLVDELAAPEPATFQFLLHGLRPFTLVTNEHRLRLQQPRAGVTIQYLSPVTLAFRQWDGFEPPPLRGDFANHWHVEASTTEPQTALRLITVLAVERGEIQRRLTANRFESDTALGVETTFAGRRFWVAVRKAGVTAPAELQGQRLDGPVCVRAE